MRPILLAALTASLLLPLSAQDEVAAQGTGEDVVARGPGQPGARAGRRLVAPPPPVLVCRPFGRPWRRSSAVPPSSPTLAFAR